MTTVLASREGPPGSFLTCPRTDGLSEPVALSLLSGRTHSRGQHFLVAGAHGGCRARRGSPCRQHPDSCGCGTRGAGAPQAPQHVRMGPLRCSRVLGSGQCRAGTGCRAGRGLGPVLTSLCHSRRRTSQEGEKHGPPASSVFG